MKSQLDCVGESRNSVNNNCNKSIDQYHTPKKLIIHTKTGVETTSADRLPNLTTRRLSRKASFLDNLEVQCESEAHLLVLYTGGTIGMRTVNGVYCPEQNYLPQAIRSLPTLNDAEYVDAHYGDDIVRPFCLPPVRRCKWRIVYWIVEYEPLLDSSDMTFDDWIRITNDIQKAYHTYDGFLVLHGTDTLAFTASALSFLLENLEKPVVVTGSQIPVCEVRSDGRDNFICALVMAANYDIPEVTVCFNNKLMRGNRSTKLDNNGLDAFSSPNMPPIAQMAIDIKVSYESIYRSKYTAPFRAHGTLNRNVALLRIFPSISTELVKASLQPPIEGIILQTYGAGNMPTRRTDIIEILKEAISRGCIVINCTQCIKGKVDMYYATGKILYDIGVIPGSDMTVEAAITKLSYVLSKNEWDLNSKKKMMRWNIRGELTAAKTDLMQDLEIIPRPIDFLCIGATHEADLLRSALFRQLLRHLTNKNDVNILKKIYQDGGTPSEPDAAGKSSSKIATDPEDLALIKYPLKHGESAKTRDNWENTTFTNAVQCSDIKPVQTLLESGASSANQPVDLGSKLCTAAFKEDYNFLKGCVQAGANINEPNYDGRSALHIAVANKKTKLVEYLINNGADRNALDNFGTTPFTIAEKNKWQTIIHLLTVEKL